MSDYPTDWTLENIEKWAREHPIDYRQEYQGEFREATPNAKEIISALMEIGHEQDCPEASHAGMGLRHYGGDPVKALISVVGHLAYKSKRLTEIATRLSGLSPNPLPLDVWKMPSDPDTDSP